MSHTACLVSMDVCSDNKFQQNRLTFQVDFVISFCYLVAILLSLILLQETNLSYERQLSPVEEEKPFNLKFSSLSDLFSLCNASS